MSPDETRRLLAVAANLKARVPLSLSYGCSIPIIDEAISLLRMIASKIQRGYEQA